ncbi:hypothetical protein Q4S45_07490 [Massilia sp. R2A-15]|uniref:hypothetical protein n=1 Tax=Massilia sp. R2A-15 TaxID=3064278 RepID=UPI002735B2BF|nr:hypothetical protein [Massilia sp. R2A-15]WLI90951.1 hypothetical protein Q4S45_07490 [Massilia sp. R2A-15]
MLQRLVLVNSKNILCSHCGERSLVLWPNLFQRAARPERAIIRPPVLARRMMY